MPSIEVGSTAMPLPSAEINLGGTSTSEKQFLMASASGSLAAGQPLTCFADGSNVLKRRPFKVVVGGRVTGAGATNFTGKLYLGTSSTIASNTNIASTGAVATAGNTGTWHLEADLAWNSDNGIVSGIQRGWVIAVAVAQATLTTSASITTLNTENSNNGFTVTGQFSSGIAGNAAYVDYFEVLTR
jgi:hypothetical protein